MKTTGIFISMSMLLFMASCGGKDETGSETGQSSTPVKEEKVTYMKWNDSTKTMEDMSWVTKYQYAEIRNGSIYVIMSDIDRGDNYLSQGPENSNILQITTMGNATEGGKREGTYPTDETGAGNLTPHIGGKQHTVCCGRYGDKATSGYLKITRITDKLIEGEAEQHGFDSTYIKVKFSAPLIAIEGERVE